MSSPTERTLAWLRKNGFTAGVVERRNPKMLRVTHDYLGIIDLIAVGEGHTIGVQATSAANVGSRVNKVIESDNCAAWIKGNNRLLVVGWSKKGPRGAVKRWTPTIREIVLIGETPFALRETQLTRTPPAERSQQC